MKLIPMRFAGYEWRHNPREIKFECEKKINELLAPNQGAEIQDAGRKNMVVKGEGELYGNDCLEQFNALLALFKKDGKGVLAIERITPFFAVFESVKLIGAPRENVLSYSFVFREVMGEKQSDPPAQYTAAQGEDLWDISYKFGIVIDELVRLNPQVRRPDMLTEGEVIRLC